ncbi:hypothetical protein BGZ76_004623 [Entomortierella beljakovae]|nr:hypothetical protein BGZ76_004623 [Entomortierella beljakovae]
MAIETLAEHYDAIKDITLTDFLNADKTVTTFNASDLWKDKPVILFVARRPGCQFCREEAHYLLEHRDIIEKEMGFRMVVITHQKKGSDIFKDEYWAGGELYWDRSKGFYKALGGGDLRWGSIDQFFRPSVWFNTIRNIQSGVFGNFVGEGRIFGGLYIVRKGGEGIAFKHQEQVFGDLTPISEVLKVCSEVSGVSLEDATLQRAKAQEAQSLEKKQAAAAAGVTDCDSDVCALPSKL